MISGTMMQQLRRGSASKRVPISLGLFVMLSALGCQPSRGPDRLALGGLVTIDGQPLSSGTLILQPNQPGGVTAAATIRGGKFQFSSLDGPTVGRYQIRLEPSHPEFEQFASEPTLMPTQKNSMIPKQYSEFGDFTVEVAATGIVPAVLQLKSR